MPSDFYYRGKCVIIEQGLGYCSLEDTTTGEVVVVDNEQDANEIMTSLGLLIEYYEMQESEDN